MVGLFRVIMPVADIEAAARFYAELLDMPGERIAPQRHYFDCAGTILALVDPEAHQEPFRQNPDHICLAVADLESAFERAKRAGCSELDPAIDSRPWGERSFYAKDPFGNPICLVDASTKYTGGPFARGSRLTIACS